MLCCRAHVCDCVLCEWERGRAHVARGNSSRARARACSQVVIRAPSSVGGCVVPLKSLSGQPAGYAVLLAACAWQCLSASCVLLRAVWRGPALLARAGAQMSIMRWRARKAHAFPRVIPVWAHVCGRAALLAGWVEHGGSLAGSAQCSAPTHGGELVWQAHACHRWATEARGCARVWEGGHAADTMVAWSRPMRRHVGSARIHWHVGEA